MTPDVGTGPFCEYLILKEGLPNEAPAGVGSWEGFDVPALPPQAERWFPRVKPVTPRSHWVPLHLIYPSEFQLFKEIVLIALEFKFKDIISIIAPLF